MKLRFYLNDLMLNYWKTLSRNISVNHESFGEEILLFIPCRAVVIKLMF
jgi:hypothetical protein